MLDSGMVNTEDTTTHTVDLPYEQEELRMLFDLASKEDVEDGGGRYDRRGGAINVWSHPWTNDALRHDSETIGTFYGIVSLSKFAPRRLSLEKM